jgi:Na+-translocating ferredoxin:NAD+ oxidoreductase RNF subunit RnfB
MFKIIYSIFVEALIPLSVIGLIFGLGLAIAARLLTVKKDELLEKLEEALPHINCGACGFAGCTAYAAALSKGNVELTLCTPGGEKVALNIAAILGKEVSYVKEKSVAQVCCKGGRGIARYKYNYDGLEDCNALQTLYGGNKVCVYGCLGKGSCIKVCPVEAITYDTQGLVWVDKELCISCGKCIEICPTRVMQYIPYQADYFVACNSTDKGAVVRKYCKVGCTGCTLCEKKSPAGGFKVENFLARIDYTKSGERVMAAKACPAHCIIDNTREAQLVSLTTKAVPETAQAPSQ